MSITITIAGKTYEADLSREPRPNSPVSVSITCNGVWAGKGRLTRACRIEDCAADLGEEVYEAIEEEISEALARGQYSEMDPTC